MVAGVTRTAGPSLSYTFDGLLPAGVTWSGPVTGAVSFGWDNKFRLMQETVAGSAVSFGYDPDDLLTSAGALTLTRDAASGLMTASTLGNTTAGWTYNGFGEVMTYTGTYGTTSLLSLTYERDAAGRIIAVTGGDAARGFQYDAARRLMRVTGSGTPISEYDYDANGNRTEHRYLGGSETATYDEQDRLRTYGGTTYEYTEDGDLRSKTIAGSTTLYDYDAFGNLVAVELPGGTKIDYVIDGQNRRVGKKVNGTLTRGWLYADQLRIAAELDGANTIVSRFVYASRSNVPDYMIRGGVTYRIFSDHLGSPRVVVNASTGEIAQSVTYDEFGRVLTDSAPGFQPAGGLYDGDTELVRFGRGTTIRMWDDGQRKSRSALLVG